MFSLRLWRMARHNAIVAALSIPITLVFTSCSCSGLSCQPATLDDGSGKTTATPQVIERLPVFSVKDTSGREISSATLKDKVVLVDFWATWCPPCRKEIPHFNQLYARYRDEGLMIVGLALDETEADVTRFNQQLPIEYPVALASKEVQQQFGGIEVYPTAFLIDRHGRVIKTYLGFTYPDEFERDIGAAITNADPE